MQKVDLNYDLAYKEVTDDLLHDYINFFKPLITWRKEGG